MKKFKLIKRVPDDDPVDDDEEAQPEIPTKPPKNP